MEPSTSFISRPEAHEPKMRVWVCVCTCARAHVCSFDAESRPNDSGHMGLVKNWGMYLCLLLLMETSLKKGIFCTILFSQIWFRPFSTLVLWPTVVIPFFLLCVMCCGSLYTDEHMAGRSTAGNHGEQPNSSSSDRNPTLSKQRVDHTFQLCHWKLMRKPAKGNVCNISMHK